MRSNSAPAAMSRTTTFIAVLQTTLVVMGFLILPGIFKLWGYPVEPQFFGYRWNPLSLWLRQYGPWLLVLPAFWVAFVSVAQRRGRGFFSQRLALIIGVCLAALIILLFLYAATYPVYFPSRSP